MTKKGKTAQKEEGIREQIVFGCPGKKKGEHVVNNFMRIKSFNPFRQNFMYFDVPEYLADQIFIRHKLRVKFKKEYTSDKSKFHVIFCSCAKNRIRDFEESMEELSRAVLIMGYAGYEELCRDLTGKIALAAD